MGEVIELQRPARFAMRVITLSRVTTASTKNYPVLVVVRPVVSHNRATIHQDARNNLGQRNKGIRMRGSRRWSAEEKELELERTIPIFRAAPGEVLAEREAAWAAELTPNMVVLGDPLPGRSALDAKYRTSLH